MFKIIFGSVSLLLLFVLLGLFVVNNYLGRSIKYDRQIWLANYPTPKNNKRVWMSDSALAQIYPGETKQDLLYLLGKPTAELRKGQSVSDVKGFSGYFYLSFDRDVEHPSAISSENKKGLSNPRNFEIWYYVLGLDGFNDQVELKVWFDKRGRVTKKYLGE